MSGNLCFHDLSALKRIIELGFRGGATEPKLNPSQARSGKHAENEREGTRVVKVKFSEIF